MTEIEKARSTRQIVRIAATTVIAVATGFEWGVNAGWIAGASCCLIVALSTGIEQEFRRIADAVRRAEERTVGK